LGEEFNFIPRRGLVRQLYAGCDLHGNSNLIGIIDGEEKRVFKKKQLNDFSLVRDTLKPFQEELVGIAVGSTYHWYWLVDGLMEEEYKVHLANPSAI
jgi:transposase